MCKVVRYAVQVRALRGLGPRGSGVRLVARGVIGLAVPTSAGSGVAVTSAPAVFRPVHYLGSKLRSLDPIERVIVDEGVEGETVWEPFTGSSVVAQRLAASGMRLVANDALVSSATYAEAMLGVGRREGDGDAAALINCLEQSFEGDFGRWQAAVRDEDAAVITGNGDALLAHGRGLPQRWKVGRGSPEGAAPVGLLSATYAGTYFGLRQALELERLRSSVDVLTRGDRIDAWQRAVALTAICSAASKAVFSAGKHFAQPLLVHARKSQAFHERRIVVDRRVNVLTETFEAIRSIYAMARPGWEGHNASIGLAEHRSSDDLRRENVTTVYADPPYTAQQYSRFYHVLEVLVEGAPADLQVRNGEVTRGLYPAERYKSPYCSRVQAPHAFRHLAEISYDGGARLVLSYSGSDAKSTGNPRSIGMADLTSLLRGVFPRVHVESLDLNYRQFNSAESAIAHRSDPEVLIVAEIH